jgi:type I restriction-modification system DNA methylase subunit
MNLAVHGLEGDIREANSYYEDEHGSTGNFDFVLANPPFNVNAVDKDRLKDAVGKNRRYPFGLPRTDNGKISGFSSSIPRSTKKAEPASSWPTPPPTLAPPSKKSASSSLSHMLST